MKSYVEKLKESNKKRLINHGVRLEWADKDEQNLDMKQDPRKGRWIKTPKAVMGEGYMWYCDKCKHQVYQDSSRDYPSEKFCPCCGSDNREAEE